MARLSIDLDDELLDEAGQILETSTHTETVESALREIIAVRQRVIALERLRKLAAEGAVDLEFLSDKENYRPRPKIFDLPEEPAGPAG